MKIPVTVVDDEQVDRYTVRRRLSRHGGFRDVVEVESGDVFLDVHCSGASDIETDGLPLLILMDINMPGRNGFETVREMEVRQSKGLAVPSIVVTMLTSSGNPRDKAEADKLPLVRGYIEKPLDADGAQRLFDLYHAELKARAA